jgi:hypothetical protein
MPGPALIRPIRNLHARSERMALHLYHKRPFSPQTEIARKPYRQATLSDNPVFLALPEKTLP